MAVNRLRHLGAAAMLVSYSSRIVCGHEEPGRCQPIPPPTARLAMSNHMAYAIPVLDGTGTSRWLALLTTS